VIVNRPTTVTGWEVAARTQRAGYQGRCWRSSTDWTIADAVPDAASERSALLRPSSPALLEEIGAQGRAAPSPARALPPLPESAYHGIIGDSSQMRDIFSRVDKVAAGDVNVCIHGECHRQGADRARDPLREPAARPSLITLDCTTIPDGLMESHLFGHVKGAYTARTEHREGVFALAHTGTLFIDELGD